MSVVSEGLAPLTIGEWSPPLEVNYGDPAPADRRLAEQLRSGDAMIELDWLRDGKLRISSKAWVGVVRLTNLEIRVVPKLVGEELGVLAMIEYCSGLSALRRVESVRSLQAGGANLIDLVCEMLNLEADGIVRQGLLQDYVAREDDLTMLRGRLRLREQATRRFGQVIPVDCAYDEYEGDIVENRILGAGLLAARRIATNREVRQRSARLEAVFAEVCEFSDLDPAAAQAEFEYYRRNENYRSGHAWAFMLLEQANIRELFDNGDRRVSAFFINMNRLFERFVTRVLSDAFAGTSVRVASQQRTPSIIVNEGSGRTYARIIPDIMLRSTGEGIRQALPVDAKYKLYDDKGIAQSDIYQTFMYAIAFADPGGPLPATVIVYPGRITGRATELAILREAKERTARIHCLSLDVKSLLHARAFGQWSGSVAGIRDLFADCLAA
jgi:5-methylcytosine-specific restriction enzyme subunit McrC